MTSLRGVCCCLVLLLGCSFDTSGAESPSFDPGDVGDGDPQVPQHAPLVLEAPGTWLLDTDSLSLVDPNGQHPPTTIELANATDGTEIVVVRADHVAIARDATLRVRGRRPAVLTARTGIIVRGAIDVSSGAERIGAGSDPTECADGAAQPGENSLTGGGGGGGGALFGNGGHGGAGKDTTEAGGGLAPIVLSPIPLGGCAGASGGVADGLSSGSSGGFGGGAVWLVAATSVELYGTVAASGQGGAFGVGTGGGGGGGAGGSIRIDAPIVLAYDGAVLAANGGGGGEGGDPELGGVGYPGDDGIASDDQARGGRGGARKGGDGGNAGFVRDVDGRDGRDSDVGGGGGGGAGAIWLFAERVVIESGAVVSPAPIAIDLSL